MTQLPPPPEGYEGLDQPPSAGSTPSPPEVVSVPALDRKPVETSPLHGQNSESSPPTRSKRMWLCGLGLIAVIGVVAIAIVDASQNSSNWDYSASYQENAEALAGKPIDDHFAPMVDAFNHRLENSMFSVDTDYWASYVMWAGYGCELLSNYFEESVTTRWRAQYSADFLHELVDEIAAFMRTDTPGFRTMTIMERKAIIAAAFVVGDCQDVYVDWTDLTGDPGPLPSLRR